jgi:hypothetical protein
LGVEVLLQILFAHSRLQVLQQGSHARGSDARGELELGNLLRFTMHSQSGLGVHENGGGIRDASPLAAELAEQIDEIGG